MSEYDYEGYAKILEKTLDACQKDYWTQYIDINRHQINVAKTYLWVSAALLGAYAAGYDRFSEFIISSAVCGQVFFSLSFLVGVIAFGICLYAIPARKGYLPIPNRG
jgi:hypothetical protein